MEDRSALASFALDACRSSPEGADLAVAAFVQALRSYRRASVCTPFPKFFANEHNASEKNFSSLEEAVQHFPQIREPFFINLTSMPAPTLSLGYLIGEMPYYSLKVFAWVLRSSHRLQLMSKPMEELSHMLPSRNSTRAALPDFIVKVQEEQDDARFEELKLKYGTLFAFHGTRGENLHSIMHCGLLNLSRTELQRNGATFGDGIYFSSDLAVALNFSNASEGWSQSCFGKSQRYILVCEIAKGHGIVYSKAEEHEPSGTRKDPGYIIVQNSDLVRIRYVLIYSEAHLHDQTMGSSPSTQREKQSRENIGAARYLRRNACKIIAVLYCLLLLLIGLVKSDVTKHRKLSRSVNQFLF